MSQEVIVDLCKSIVDCVANNDLVIRQKESSTLTQSLFLLGIIVVDDAHVDYRYNTLDEIKEETLNE